MINWYIYQMRTLLHLTIIWPVNNSPPSKKIKNSGSSEVLSWKTILFREKEPQFFWGIPWIIKSIFRQKKILHHWKNHELRVIRISFVKKQFLFGKKNHNCFEENPKSSNSFKSIFLSLFMQKSWINLFILCLFYVFKKSKILHVHIPGTFW